MSNNAEAALLDRDANHVIHPLHSRAVHAKGKVWVGGEGAYLTDANGDRFIDGLSGLWNNTAGNGRRELVEAGSRQLEEMAFASGYAGSSNPRAIELGEKIARITYPNINQFYFTSGGGESTDSNIKMARYYWKLKGKPNKTKVISRILGYHGVTFAAMCATGIDIYWPMFEPRIPGFRHIPSPYPYFYQAPEGAESQGIAAADELEKAILEEGPDTVAMFIAEPVQGAGGVIVPQDDYFPRIREICDKYEVLLVSDEVITGFGRTGKMFAVEHSGVEPDIITVAKGVASGLPLGAVVARAELMHWDRGAHASTFGGNPVSCAAALATLDLLEGGLVAHAAEMGEHLRLGLTEVMARHPTIGDVRGLGLMTAVDLVASRETRQPDPALRDAVLEQAFQRGVLLLGCGQGAIRFSPPLVISRPQIDRAVEIFDAAVAAATSG